MTWIEMAEERLWQVLEGQDGGQSGSMAAKTKLVKALLEHAMSA